LIVLNIPILVMVSIWFWFYSNAYLLWSPDNFDHIMSPLGGVISALLLGYTVIQAQKQIRYSQDQVNFSQEQAKMSYIQKEISQQQFLIARSQITKPYFDEKFERIKEKWSAPSSLPNHPKTSKPTTSKSLITDICSAYNMMLNFGIFKEDLNNYLENETPLSLYDHYHRSYNHFSAYLNLLIVDALVDFITLKEFIIEINNSELVPTEKQLFKKKVREVLAQDYINFFDQNDFDTSIFLIPITSVAGNANVKFEQIHRSAFRKHYDFLKEHLG
jgi:hypothetical protein